MENKFNPFISIWQDFSFNLGLPGPGFTLIGLKLPTALILYTLSPPNSRFLGPWKWPRIWKSRIWSPFYIVKVIFGARPFLKVPYLGFLKFQNQATIFLTFNHLHSLSRAYLCMMFCLWTTTSTETRRLRLLHIFLASIQHDQESHSRHFNACKFPNKTKQKFREKC